MIEAKGEGGDLFEVLLKMDALERNLTASNSAVLSSESSAPSAHSQLDASPAIFAKLSLVS